MKILQFLLVSHWLDSKYKSCISKPLLHALDSIALPLVVVFFFALCTQSENWYPLFTLHEKCGRHCKPVNAITFSASSDILCNVVQEWQQLVSTGACGPSSGHGCAVFTAQPTFCDGQICSFEPALHWHNNYGGCIGQLPLPDSLIHVEATIELHADRPARETSSGGGDPAKADLSDSPACRCQGGESPCTRQQGHAKRHGRPPAHPCGCCPRPCRW